MRIAVTSQDYRSVTAHAGRARRFLVFEADGTAPPREVGRLELLPEATVHEWQGRGPHPLDGVEVVLTRSYGEHFALRLGRRGILAALTEDEQPLAAVERFLAAPDLDARLAQARAGRLAEAVEPAEPPAAAVGESASHHGHDCGCRSGA